VVEVTLMVRGKADTAELEGLKRRLQELAPSLQRVFDSGVVDRARDAVSRYRERLDGVGSGVRDVGSKTDDAKRKTEGWIDKLGRIGMASIGINAIKGALVGVGAALTGLVSGNAQFETFETQFATLLKGAESYEVGLERAKAKMAELAEFAAKTPFELPQLAAAEKVLLGFGLTGNSVMSKFGVDLAGLRTSIGDMAAGTGVNFAELANTWGKFSSGASGEAISRLQELGIVTREQLRGVGIEFSKSGELTSPLPEALQAALKIANEKFGGGMKNLSSTFEGNMSTLSDNFGQIKRTLAAPIFDVLKDGVAKVNEVLSSDGFQGTLQRVGSLLAGQFSQGIAWAKGAFDAWVQGGGLERLKGLLMSLGTGLVLFLQTARAVGSWLVEHKEVVIGFAAALGIFAIAAGIASVQAWIAAGGIAAMLAPILGLSLPLVGLAALIGVLAAAWAGNWGGIRETTASVIETVKGYFSGLIDTVKALFSGDLSGAFDSYRAVVESVFGSGAASALDRGREAFGGYVQYLKGILTGDLASATAGARQAFEAIFGPEALAKLDELAARFEEWRSSIVATVEGWASDVAQKASSLWDTLAGMWSSGVASVVDLASGLWDRLVMIWENIRIAVSGAANGLILWLQESWSGLAGWLAGLWVRVSANFSRAWSWIATTVSGVAARLINWLSTNFGAAGRFLASLLQRTMSLFSTAWTWIKNTVSRVSTSLVNGVVSAFHWLGQAATRIWQKMGELFGSAWRGIISIFRGAVESILPGVSNFFVKLVELGQRGLRAFTGLIGKAVNWIVKQFQALFGVLGSIGGEDGGPFAGILSSITNFASNIGSSFADGLGDVVSGVRGALGSISGWFSDKIADARGFISDLFGGGADSLQAAAAEAAAAAPGLDAGGPAGQVAGLGGGGGGGGGGGDKEQLDVGSQGSDKNGDWYIDENGKKVYTSGAGKARQEAQARAQAEKASKAKGKAARDGAKAGAEKDAAEGADSAPSLLKTMSDIAKRAAEAAQAGLAAIRDLVQGQMPDRAVWEPRLIALNDFVAVALQRLQDTGRQLFAQVGSLEDGADILEGSSAQMIEATTKLFGGALDVVTKASTFLQSIVKVKYPEPAQIAAAMVTIGLLLTTVRDQGVALSAPFKDKEAVEVVQAAGGAVGAWTDSVLKLADGSARLAQVAPVPPSALTVIRGLMGTVAGIMQSFVTGPLPNGGTYNLLDDTETTKENLGVVSELASTLDRAVDLVTKVSSAAEGLARTPRVGDTALATVRDILQGTRDALAGLVVGPGYNLLQDRDRTREDLGVVATLIDTLDRGVGLISKVSLMARDLARTPRVGESAVQTVQDILGTVQRTLASFLIGPGYNLLRDGDRTKEDLSVVSALTATLDQGLGLIGRTVALARESKGIRPLEPAVLDNVRAVVSGLSSMLSSLLMGTGPDGKPYNLLADDRATTADLGVVQGFIQTLAQGVALLRDASALGETLASSMPIDPARMRDLLGRLDEARQAVQGFALGLAASLEAQGQYLEDVQPKIASWGAMVRETLGILDLAKKASTGDAEALDAGALRQYLDNAVTVLANVMDYTRSFFASYDTVFGSGAEDEIAKARQQVADWGSFLKEALSIFDLSKKLDTGAVQEADPGGIRQALDNAVVVLANVQDYVSQYFASYEAAFGAGAERKIEQMRARLTAWASQVREALSIATEAAKFTLGDVAIVDASDVRQALDNASLVEAMVRDGVGAWLVALGEPARERLQELTDRVKLWGAQVKESFSALKEAASFTVGDVAVLETAKLQVLIDNASLAVGAVDTAARAWVAGIVASGRTLEQAGQETKLFSELAKGAFDLFKAGVDLALEDIRTLSPIQIQQLIANARLVLDAWSTAAGEWARGLVDAGRSSETVVQETKAFSDVLKATTDGLLSVHKLMLELSAEQTTAEQKLAKRAPAPDALLAGLRDRIVMMVRLMSDAYRTLESEEGTLKRAGDLATTVAPAAEALAKVLDSLSLDRLLKSPLINTKLGSAFQTGVRKNRLDELARQITEGVKRTVQALIDGLRGVVVPKDIDTGLDRVASAYERIVAILERIRELSAPDPAKIREIATLASLLVSSLQGIADIGGTPGAGLDPGILRPTRAPVGAIGPGSGPLKAIAAFGAAGLKIAGADPRFAPIGGGAGLPVNPPGVSAGPVTLQAKDVTIPSATIDKLGLNVTLKVGERDVAPIMVEALQRDQASLDNLIKVIDQRKGGRG